VAKSVKTYGFVRGIATSCDAYHPTSPDPQAVQIHRCVKESLFNAKLNPNDVDIFIPHATGTKLNDEIEMKLLYKLFPKNFSMDSTILLKKYIGHTGGASAAFSLLVAALELSCSYILALGDFKKRSALVNCTAFGGHNSTIILTSY
jgi:3-oxoacyl-[acyl-carrier-protein] synthase II